jgi:hypothetical protein
MLIIVSAILATAIIFAIAITIGKVLLWVGNKVNNLIKLYYGKA